MRKQVLTIRADPLSPDSGQYAFVQGLLRTVAYGMLSRRERKPRHRAAAEHLRRVFPNDGEEVAEVIAAHYLDAYRAALSGSRRAASFAARRMTALRRAAQRAAAVGAPESAERSYRTASELAEDELERTELTRAAGEMALQAGRLEAALELFEQVADAHTAAGREREAAHVAGRIGRALNRLGRNEEAIERIVPALEVLGADRLDPDVAALHAMLGHTLLFAGHDERGRTAAGVGDANRRGSRSAGGAQRGPHRQGTHLPAGQPHRGGAARCSMPRRRSPNGTSWRPSSPSPTATAATSACSGTCRRPPSTTPRRSPWHAARATASARASPRATSSISMSTPVAGTRPKTLAAELLGNEDRAGGEFLHFPLAILHTFRGDLEAAVDSFARIAAWEQGDDDELRAIHTSVAIRLHLAGGRPR